MATSQFDTDELELLQAAAKGDDDARQRLLARHRGRLRQMVAVYLDHRLAARVDPSDVVQEALAEAARGLAGYLRERPLPFYPWLRHLLDDGGSEVQP
jgi:RNA polymerase sigma-70 factor (ECF subfamily)